MKYKVDVYVFGVKVNSFEVSDTEELTKGSMKDGIWYNLPDGSYIRAMYFYGESTDTPSGITFVTNPQKDND